MYNRYQCIVSNFVVTITTIIIIIIISIIIVLIEIYVHGM